MDRVVDDVSLAVGPAQTVGLVGESGSGKTVSALATIGLAQALGAKVAARSIQFEGQELTTLRPSAMNRLRGSRIGMIFQQPARSLDPAYTVGDQIAETVRRFGDVSRKEAWRRAVEMLDRVHIADAAKRAKEYPHTFSGGMCQRVMIAMALACGPSLLIADEPTTALDVTVQARILDLLRELQRDTGVAILFISHDLGVIAEMCESVLVMYAGRVVEAAPADDLFFAAEAPLHRGAPRLDPPSRQVEASSPSPATSPRWTTSRRAAASIPGAAYAVAGRCDGAEPELEPLSSAHSAAMRPRRASCRWQAWRSRHDSAAGRGRGAWRSPSARRAPSCGRAGDPFHAVRGVSFTLAAGETLALVGESGAGKSTTGRLLLRLIEPDAGRITFDGTDVLALSADELRATRRRMQMIFQDPFGSLDPRVPIGESVAEPLLVHFRMKHGERLDRAAALLERCGMGRHHLGRYPADLSGGQLQRAAIARALTLSPQLIVADEPVAALDVSVRAQVLNLMKELQEEFGMSYLFITHDLALVEVIADRIAVMQHGEIVEEGSVERSSRHPSMTTRRSCSPRSLCRIRGDGWPQRQVHERLLQARPRRSRAGQSPICSVGGDRMNELDGKCVVITGSGRGLGAAYARAAPSAVGAAVVVNDIDARPGCGGGRGDPGRRWRRRWTSSPTSRRGASAAAGRRRVHRHVRAASTGSSNNAGLFSMSRLEEMAPR